jgi:hypothetical protein
MLKHVFDPIPHRTLAELHERQSPFARPRAHGRELDAKLPGELLRREKPRARPSFELRKVNLFALGRDQSENALDGLYSFGLFFEVSDVDLSALP